MRPLLNDLDTDDYHWDEDDARELKNYCPGGYHPIHIGDRLAEQYLILGKLGCGGFGTIWLAKDGKKMRYVAIKIAISSIDNPPETAIIRHLVRFGGANFVPKILDEFTITGPNGEHLCIVMELACTSLGSILRSNEYDTTMPLAVVRSVIHQILRAVEFLHDEGVVHGDLHPGNILLRLTAPVHHLDTSELYQVFGEPKTGLLPEYYEQKTPHRPLYITKCAKLGADPKKLTIQNTRVFLSDFGEAFVACIEPRTSYGFYTMCKPPEEWFCKDKPISFPSDIWSLGASIFQILTLTSLFAENRPIPDEDEIMERWVEILGKPPQGWWERWENRLQYCQEDGKIIEADGAGYMNLRSRLVKANLKDSRLPKPAACVSDMQIDELACLYALLKRIFAYKPEDRATIKDILSSRWVREWVVPCSQGQSEEVTGVMPAQIPLPDSRESLQLPQVDVFNLESIPFPRPSAVESSVPRVSPPTSALQSTCRLDCCKQSSSRVYPHSMIRLGTLAEGQASRQSMTGQASTTERQCSLQRYLSMVKKMFSKKDNK